MSKWLFPVAGCLVLTLSASAFAEPNTPSAGRALPRGTMVFTTRGGEPVVMTAESIWGGKTYSGDSYYGYPFRSGCCEARNHCCDDLWVGYCSEQHCWSHYGWGLGHGRGCGCGSGSGCSVGKGKYEKASSDSAPAEPQADNALVTPPSIEDSAQIQNWPQDGVSVNR